MQAGRCGRLPITRGLEATDPQADMRSLWTAAWFADVRSSSNAAYSRNRRPSVRTNQIDALVALVDEHGSDVVCKLLVAYGYARDPKVQQQGDTPLEGSPTNDDVESDGE